MSEREDINEILKRSEAYRSLKAEQEVAAWLVRLGWRTAQSPYYVDEKTCKLRELDLAAHRWWEKPRKAGNLTARVNLFIEVKTNSDFHILCAGRTSGPFAFEENEHWIGYSEDARHRIEVQLSKFHLTHEEISDFVHEVEKAAFPRHMMRTSVLRVKPPPIEHNFSAFRETNGRSDKDLDNSVLWRATLALRSAVRSAKGGRIEALVSDMETGLEAARRLKLPFRSAMSSIDPHACTIDLYLPIVVIQSRIWSTQAAVLEELKWVRLVQFNTLGGTQDWTDVVNFNHFEDYLQEKTEYFDRAFRKARAKHLR